MALKSIKKGGLQHLHHTGLNKLSCLYQSQSDSKVSVVHLLVILQGVPKKMVIQKGFEFLTLGGVFLGVKKDSKNFGNKKNTGLFSKILSKWALFCSKSSNFLEFSRLWHFQKVKNHLESLNI